MKHSRASSLSIAAFWLILNMTLLITACSSGISQSERESSRSQESDSRRVESSSRVDRYESSSQTKPKTSYTPKASSSSSASDEAERSRLLAEVQRRLNEISSRKQSSSGESGSSYPEDPYHVYEYDDPDLFYEDWCDEFGSYDDCYDYWDRAWGNYSP